MTGRATTIAVAGAGVSGATIARQLADVGHRVHVVDPRPHVAGNCHTERAANGTMLHRYGPHIFHTASERVWNHIRRFGEMVPYRHRVRALANGRDYSLPINLTTINDFFGTTLDSDGARRLIADRAAPYRNGPQRTFRDRALATIGPELYTAFFEGYTAKQWGVDPAQLPASVFARLPVRFSADDEYFDHPYQAIPRHGYSAIVDAMLDHPAITVELGTRFEPAAGAGYDHVFWTAPLDEYFGRVHGALRYRTIDFEFVDVDAPVQSTAVLNRCDADVPITRTTDYRHFTPWEDATASVVSSERPREWTDGDIPYYPLRLVDDTERLDRYVGLARAARGVTFLGRLGTYRYLDMDVAIDQALHAADAHLAALATGARPPAFAAETPR